MIRFNVMIIMCCLAAGCATTRQTHDYKWDISLKPNADDGYDFTAVLHRNTVTTIESARKRTEHENRDTLFFPTIRLHKNDQEQVQVGLDGRPPTMEAYVSLSNVNGVVTATYRLLYRKADGTQESHGRIELAE